MVMAFIDAHRVELGIEPICRELAIAPSSYHEYAARLADPGRRSARARRDDEIGAQVRRVHEASFGLYGVRKVWHQMQREGIKVAKCTVERLMRAMGLAGVRRGKKTVTTVSNPKTPCPLDKVNRPLPEKLNLKAARFELEPEITAQLCKRGYKILELPIGYKPRTSAEGKKLSWRDGFAAAYTLIDQRFRA